MGARYERALMVRWRDHVRSLHHMRAELAGPKYQVRALLSADADNECTVPEICNIPRIALCTVD